MARGRRMLVIAQAVLAGSSASAEQVQWYIATGLLECTPAGATPKPEPYDADKLKALHASGQLG